MSANFPGWETPFGFKWGPATIERMAEVPDGLEYGSRMVSD